MTGPLALLWPTTEAAPYIWCLDGQQGEAASLADLPTAEAVRVALPGEAVLVRRLALPTPSPAKARAALRFALDDDLATEGATLHSSYGPSLDGGVERLAAAVDLDFMQTVYRALLGAGLQPDWIGPDFLIAATEPNTAVLVTQGARCLLGQADQGGFALEADLADTVAPAWLARHSPERLVAHGPLPAGLDGELRPPLSRGALAAQLAARDDLPALNLLQGPFKPRRRFELDWRTWRLAAALVVGILSLQMLGHYAEARRLDRTADRLLSDAAELLQSRFPDIQRVVNPRAQIRSKLAAMEQQELGGGFLVLLSVLNRAVQGLEGSSVESLRYDARQSRLSVTVRMAGFAEIERFRARVEEAGGALEEGGARQSEGAVLGEFELWKP